MRAASRSVKRGGDEGESTLLGGDDKFNPGDTTIFGLGGELALKASGKHAKKKANQAKRELEE